MQGLEDCNPRSHEGGEGVRLKLASGRSEESGGVVLHPRVTKGIKRKEANGKSCD